MVKKVTGGEGVLRQEVTDEDQFALRSLESAQAAREGLLEHFKAELAISQEGTRDTKQDRLAAGILPTLLDLTVKVDQKRLGRSFSQSKQLESRALTAAALLNWMPRATYGALYSYDYCATRGVLWEHIADGVTACAKKEKPVSPGMAEALLYPGELSDHEVKVLKDVLRKRLLGYKAHRAVLRAFKYPCQTEFVRVVLNGLIKHANDDEIGEVVSKL